MNDRLQMPSAMPADLAEVLSDRADRLLNVESFMGAARDAVIEDLCDGKNVGKFWLRDVLDSAIDSNYASEVHTLAEMFSGEIDAYAITQHRNALVEAFVDRNAQLVSDRATTLAEQADEDSGEG